MINHNDKNDDNINPRNDNNINNEIWSSKITPW